MSSKRKSHTLDLNVSRNQGIFLFMPNCYEMEILSKSWLFVMIWQMDISQGSVLVSVFCLTRCNYKQCCLFAHLASGYHVRPGLSSPHVIRCPMSHLTRGRESSKWNSVWNENMIPAYNGRNLAAWGLSLLILMWPIWQYETRTFHHTQISIRATVPCSVSGIIFLFSFTPHRVPSSGYTKCTRPSLKLCILREGVLSNGPRAFRGVI